MAFNVGFIGGGNMASALIGGLLTKNWSVHQLAVADPEPSVLIRHQHSGIYTTDNNAEIVRRSDMVVLAVKPQLAHKVLMPLAALWQDCQPLLLSVVAGISTDTLKSWMGSPLRVVRAMPNTPALVQTGATGYFCPQEVDAKGCDQASEVLAAVGLTLKVRDEAQLDIVTALSGSGPAYFFYIMESLQQAAQSMGLDAEMAHALTVQTALGAAQMTKTSTDTLTGLRQKVTSPGGTTEAALAVFKEQKLHEVLNNAMQAAYHRAQELGVQFGKEPV